MIATGLRASLIPLGLVIGFAVWGWISVPADTLIPVHWGLDGQPDRFGGPLEAFGLLPLIALALTALFVVIPRMDPLGRNIAEAPTAYHTIWVASLYLLATVQGLLTLVATGMLGAGLEGRIASIMLACAAIMLAVTGNVLGKARPSWTVGVRTPWTLSSVRSWDVTHRWAGRLFVGLGIIGVAAALALPMSVATTVLVGGVGVAVVALLTMSYVVWKSDPDRPRG